MTDTEQSGRRFQVTLVVRDEKDDPSILDIVRVALEDGLRAPTVGTSPLSGPTGNAAEPEKRVPVSGGMTTPLREQIEEALAKVLEQFQATEQEPKFDPANWNANLSKLWAVVARAKAAGIQLKLVASDSPPAEAS